MKEQLAQYAMELLNLVKSGVDFAIQEVPLTLREALLYWQIRSVTWFVFSAILVVVCPVAAKKCFAKSKQIYNYELETNPEKREAYRKAYLRDHEKMYTAFGVAAVAAAALFFLVWLTAAGDALKAVFAPRLLLIEKILTIGK